MRACALKGRCSPAAASVPRSGGRALEEPLRRRFEPRFGHDFSRVRIHTSDEAAASARSFGARAYTAGEHVVFGTGEYAPQTANGARLIAHELTHVVQQRHRVSDPMEHGESEADRVANGSTERVTVGSTAPLQMQRANREIAPAVSTAVATKPVVQPRDVVKQQTTTKTVPVQSSPAGPKLLLPKGSAERVIEGPPLAAIPTTGGFFVPNVFIAYGAEIGPEASPIVVSSDGVAIDLKSEVSSVRFEWNKTAKPDSFTFTSRLPGSKTSVELKAKPLESSLLFSCNSETATFRNGDVDVVGSVRLGIRLRFYPTMKIAPRNVAPRTLPPIAATSELIEILEGVGEVLLEVLLVL